MLLITALIRKKLKSEERKIMKECKDGMIAAEEGKGNRIERKKQRKSEKRKEKLVREWEAW